MKFIDEVEITVASGKGGPGKVSFRREAMVARGGPDGGDGGRGGDLIFRVNPRLNSLIDLRLRREYRAEDGENGGSQNKAGADGKDMILEVPPGTVIKDEDDSILLDLTQPGDVVFLKGGLGGMGNTFYKTSVNQAPTVAQKGLPGDERVIKLELKLLADVGIIGLPNAGKSTLISRISAAKPKIADYPFTTITPNLGVVKLGEYRSFVVADIPGLIAGAHEGVGLGIQFLRHIERCRVFVHMIDISEMAGKDPLEAYKEIQGELKAYDKDKAGSEGFTPLATRPQLLVLNKCDSVDEDRRQEVAAKFKKKGLNPLLISAVSGQSLKELLIEIGKKVFNEDQMEEL
ncbi:MAG: GTPase ObgE [Bdellovibrionales bacterium]